MGNPKSFDQTEVTFKIAGGDDIGNQVHNLIWDANVNKGFSLKVVVRDPYFNLLKNIVNNEENQIKYLKEAKKKILPVYFKLKNGDQELEEQVAYLTEMHSTGKGADGRTIFYAIDPLSFILNRGNGNGSYYEGSVSEVIKKVVEEYGNSAGGVTVNVSKTVDSKTNRWFMYRQDPKTFIKSLIDWSSSITNNKSRWIVSSGWDADNKRPRINIKEEFDLEKLDLGIYTVSRNDSHHKDVYDWYMAMNNFTAAFQNRLTTASISATSGKYIDRKSEKKSIVQDNNTGNKINVKTGSDRAFTKPNENDWGTFIQSVPEHSDGAVGIKYESYIDGRARQKYMNLLGVSMNITIDTVGDHIVSSSEKLGATTCTLHWEDLDKEFYFLHGRWLVSGFQHYYNRNENWRTKIRCYRIDWDSNSKKV